MLSSKLDLLYRTGSKGLRSETVSMKISVAMCTYNGARFLEAQLKSIGAQTLTPSEIVICDDGSTDSTEDIVQAFAESFPFPVRFVRNERNLGSTKNFEKAMQLCAGDIIALCDQDDVWASNKLEAMGAVLEHEPDVAGVFSDATLIDQDGALTGGTLWRSIRFSGREQRRFERDPVLFLVRGSVVTGATLVLRSHFLKDILPIPPEWVHDGWIAFVLASLAKLKMVPEPLISYRLHASQQLGIQRTTRRAALGTRKKERVAFYHARARELSLMADKLATLPVSQQIAKHARAKARYMAQRVALMEGRRLPRIVKGAALLPGHFRFGLGLVSYLRDFLHA